MRQFPRSIAVLLLSVAAVAIGYFSFNAYQTAQFAWAQQKVEASREQLAHVEDLATVFREVGKTVEPSVVNIQVKKTVAGGRRMMPFDDDMLRRFFPDRDRDGQPDLPPGMDQREERDEPMIEMGTGSGVIVEAKDGTGYIVTNNHVVGGNTEIVINLTDGRTIKAAKVLGTDPKTDLAVVEVKADRLIAAKWGNSDELQKGDWVLAFGSPFGYVGSMTHGIVSALNRQAGIIDQGQGYEDFIQVDAPINPGNSGGPLVNIRGEVIGINTAIASRSGGFQGIGFAIPSNQAQYIYGELKGKGKITRGWLGIGIADVAKAPEAVRGSFTGDKGVLVSQTFPNTPAADKLLVGDIITAINGKAVENVQELRNTVAKTAPGQEIKLTVFRQGKSQDVALTVGQQPDNMMASVGGAAPQEAPSSYSAVANVGLRLSDVTEESTKRYSLPSGKSGAVVAEVAPRSPAARAGMKAGDLITRIGDKDVASVKEANELLAKGDLKKGISVVVLSREGTRLVVLEKE